MTEAGIWQGSRDRPVKTPEDIARLTGNPIYALANGDYAWTVPGLSTFCGLRRSGSLNLVASTLGMHWACGCVSANPEHVNGLRRWLWAGGRRLGNDMQL